MAMALMLPLLWTTQWEMRRKVLEEESTRGNVQVMLFSYTDDVVSILKGVMIMM